MFLFYFFFAEKDINVSEMSVFLSHNNVSDDDS